jgi:hypothetical protein
MAAIGVMSAGEINVKMAKARREMAYLSMKMKASIL